MKKLLLTLGAIASVAAPVAAVVACGTTPAATPAKTAPSKTHEAAPKAQPEDEGFAEGSLIENFDLNTESQKTEKSYELNYAGKDYDSYEAMFKDWAKDAKTFVQSSTDTHTKAGFYDITTSINGLETTVTLLDKDGNPMANEAHVASTPEEFVHLTLPRTVLAIMSQSGEVREWETKHHFEAIPEEKLSPLKHPIDSIIYSQAQSLTNTVDTKGDSVTFGTPSKEFDVIPVPTGGYTEAIANTKAGSLKKGDTITFAFDKERDLKSFTQRVGYLDAVKEMFASDNVAQHAKKLGILDGVIYSYEARDGAPDKTKAIFKLEAVAKNAVKLTFINPDQGLGSDKGTNQFLMLNGFKDINGDGIITSADKGISDPFDYK